jgi:hypothetical protein
MATKTKTGATKRKPAHGRSATRSAPPASRDIGRVARMALRNVVNMTIVTAVSAGVLGGLMAVKHFGV